MERKNRILIFGGTGYIGKYIVKASVSLGHPTLVYTRLLNSQTPPSKTQLCEEFNSMGVTLVQGELEHDQILAVIKQVDIVICALAYPQTMEQLKIIDAIKVAAVLNYEEDVGMYTVKSANDPRTRNRVVIYRPPKNIISQNELISLWEQKCGHTSRKAFISEEEIVNRSQSLPPPHNIPVSILHSVFVRGDLVAFEIGEDDLEASQLYPDYNYTSIDQLLDRFLVDPLPPASAAFG
ncbi:Isoeugenol synthase 1 [Spatholobus suberectus]|nr:Isoeugenol synthase 1 [Spatholobus suberectus]